ncbi:MAG: hypothetical protein RBT20_06040 [Syntrophales bacterium]|jgi:hypothetical protein|nr:hypothetical protein [Syntrophales bacterium]
MRIAIRVIIWRGIWFFEVMEVTKEHVRILIFFPDAFDRRGRSDYQEQEQECEAVVLRVPVVEVKIVACGDVGENEDFAWTVGWRSDGGRFPAGVKAIAPRLHGKRAGGSLRNYGSDEELKKYVTSMSHAVFTRGSGSEGKERNGG